MHEWLASSVKWEQVTWAVMEFSEHEATKESPNVSVQHGVPKQIHDDFQLIKVESVMNLVPALALLQIIIIL